MSDIVVLESPFKGGDYYTEEENVEYAQRCLKHSLELGESPFASHLLYTQALDDKIPEERRMGIEAGLKFYTIAKRSVIYADHGISDGMLKGIDRAASKPIPLVLRTLNKASRWHNIDYKSEDLFLNLHKRKKTIVAHVCNNVGAWGAGFTHYLEKHSPLSKETHLKKSMYELGEVDFVEENGFVVANMYAQEGLRGGGNPTPLKYFKLNECLRKVFTYASIHDLNVTMPKIGSGLANGGWEIIEKIVSERALDNLQCVTVFKV